MSGKCILFPRDIVRRKASKSLSIDGGKKGKLIQIKYDLITLRRLYMSGSYGVMQPEECMSELYEDGEF